MPFCRLNGKRQENGVGRKRNNPGGVRGCSFVEFYQSDQDPEKLQRIVY